MPSRRAAPGSSAFACVARWVSQRPLPPGVERPAQAAVPAAAAGGRSWQAAPEARAPAPGRAAAACASPARSTAQPVRRLRPRRQARRGRPSVGTDSLPGELGRDPSTATLAENREAISAEADIRLDDDPPAARRLDCEQRLTMTVGVLAARDPGPG